MARKKPDDLEEILADLEKIGPPTDFENPDDLVPDEVPALLHPDEGTPEPGTDGETGVTTEQRVVDDPTAPSGFVTVPVKVRTKKISQGGQVVRAAVAVAAPPAPGSADDPNTLIIDTLLQMRKEFDGISGEILGTWRQDRDQTQEAIDILMNIVRAGVGAERVHYEMLVKALEVKANTSITAVKLLDAKTRLLQALKGGTSVLINNTNTAAANASEGELTRLLSEPMRDDFEE